MKNSRSLLLSVLAVLFFFALVNLGMDLQAQFMARDPGPRGGKVGAGQPVSGLTANQMGFFQNGLQRFLEVDSVGGTISGEPGNGLGPTFNDNQCASCHSQPATGGSSPSRTAFPFIGPNPQVAVANLDGASNTVPFFISEDGPVREARFKYFLGPTGIPGGPRDGGVHDLFTIQGRVDATNVVGAIGERGLLRHAASDTGLHDAEISAVMEPPFPSVDAEDPVREAVEVLSGDQQALLVVENGRAEGLVTRTDLLEALAS